MNHPETHKVKKSDERPARMDGTCFYCREPIGGTHKPGCVCRTRSVVLEYRIQVCRGVPEDSPKSSVLFHQNEGTWCANNILDELRELVGDDENPTGRCLCTNTNVVFLREATELDEKHLGVIGLDVTGEEGK
jgi:hypothetical protein